MRQVALVLLMAIIVLATPASAAPTASSLYPNEKIPLSRTSNARAGQNVLYKVPNGRKALVTDYWITNQTAESVSTYPFLAIGTKIYRLGSDANEASATIGHNYGSNGARTIPIVLKAGESFGVSSSAPGISIWVKIVEFDESSPLNRADVQTWRSGSNYLITAPMNGSFVIGLPGEVALNNPGIVQTSMMYVNGSTGTRTISGVYIVPRKATPGNSTQFGGFNSLATNMVFAKNTPDLAPGDSIVIVSDSAADGQYAWINYRFVPSN